MRAPIFSKIICLILFFLQVDAMSAGIDDQLVIIANSDVPSKSISQSQARLMFTMDVKIWENGTSVNVVTMKQSDEIYARFSQEVLNLYPYQIERALKRKRYAGTALTSAVANSPEEMLQIVSNTSGAIGFAPKSAAARARVKIIEIRNE